MHFLESRHLWNQYQATLLPVQLSVIFQFQSIRMLNGSEGRGNQEYFDSICSIIHLLYSLCVILWQNFFSRAHCVRCWASAEKRVLSAFGGASTCGSRCKSFGGALRSQQWNGDVQCSLIGWENVNMMKVCDELKSALWLTCKMLF